MPSTAILTVVGVIVLAVLVFLFLRARQSDRVGEIMKKRAGSKLVSKADYVEGRETIPVVLSLTDDTFHYENDDLQASFELSRLDEVEYVDDLMTGKHIRANCRVLRLRSHGTTFEFLLDPLEAKKWEGALRAHRIDDAPSVAAV
jgi:hypothetical protein